MEPSPLLRIPARPVPDKFFNRGPFHTYKQAIGCAFLSSSIVILCEFGYFPGGSEAAAEQLSRAYQGFAFFTRKEWKGRTMASMKGFTKELFHWPRRDCFPAGRFKGGDCMLMHRWLRHCMLHGFLREESRQGISPMETPLEAWHMPFLRKIFTACEAGLRFFHLLHHGGVWLTRQTTRDLGMCAANFTQSFSTLARLCHARNMPRYHLVPALHAMHHFYMDSKKFLELPAQPKYCLSPATVNCEADEDFVGKISRLTRKVHASSTTQRTLERYLVKLWCESQGLR